jgi:rhamnulokinase
MVDSPKRSFDNRVTMVNSPYNRSAATKCLAIDLGASSGRLVLGEISQGRWALREIGRFRTPITSDSACGYQCWDIDEIARQVEGHLSAISGPERPASAGVDSWGVDYVLLDEALRLVGVPVCYRDKRTAGVMESVLRRMPRQEIYRRTGIQFLNFNTLYQLAACVDQEQEWMNRAQHFLMIPDYLHFRLSGVISNEYTNATTTQMCALSGDWDPVLLEAIGVRHTLMRTPVSGGTVLGEGRGIAEGLKIIAPATHDTASAVAGTPLQSSDEAYISSGTWSLMGIESTWPIATADALRMNFTNEGGLERRFRILKNIMGMWPLQRICEEHKISDPAAMVREAGLAEPWRSIIDVNDPEFLNPASMTDSIRSFCLNSAQPVPETVAQTARCVFDSLALSYRKVKEQLESLCRRKLTCIRIVGGGCQNKLLNQLCADACDLSVIAGPVEASALGNLSAQMIALGAIGDLTEARELICASFQMDQYYPRAAVPTGVLERFEGLLAAKEVKGAPCA